MTNLCLVLLALLDTAYLVMNKKIVEEKCNIWSAMERY